MKKLMISLLSVLTAVPAIAGGGYRIHEFLDIYGMMGGMLYKQKHAYKDTDVCIGVTYTDKKCASDWNFIQNDSSNEYEHRIHHSRNASGNPWWDERGYMMMVALFVHEGGSYFCPVQIGAENKNRDSTWTVYALAGQQQNHCFWVCRDGYSGYQCKDKDNYKTCDPTPIKHSDYDHLKASDTGPNIEEQVPMFVWNSYSQGHEHDMIFAVTGWLESGHGVLAQPVITFCANHSTWPDIRSSIQVYPANFSEQVLLCKDGYRPQGNDCVPANASICLAAEGKMCQGWSSGFDESIHKLVKNPDSSQDCYQYRCKQANMAFVSEDDRSCAECTASLRDGISVWDGTCASCPVGQVFMGGDVNNTSKKVCGDAYALTKTDMMYGLNNKKSDVTKLEDQCWASGTTDGYRECVLPGQYSTDGN